MVIMSVTVPATVNAPFILVIYELNNLSVAVGLLAKEVQKRDV